MEEKTMRSVLELQELVQMKLHILIHIVKILIVFTATLRISSCSG